MTFPRKLSLALATACATVAIAATPSFAIVGGGPTAPGAYPSVARVTFGIGLQFICTGTLISPNYVLTAGHCGSPTGEVTGTPVGWPAALITVTIGGDTLTNGETVPVSSVTVEPNYLLTSGYDITLLKLSRNAAEAPTPVSGTSETSLWGVGTLEKIVGWGATAEGGSTPSHLMEAQVPITTDAACGAANSGFDANTMICAGYPQGGTDTCQGDSGGPMFGTTGGGALRVVGSTSFGTGCARPNQPGVYARVGDFTLREWIRSQTPSGVA